MDPVTHRCHHHRFAVERLNLRRCVDLGFAFANALEEDVVLGALEKFKPDVTVGDAPAKRLGCTWRLLLLLLLLLLLFAGRIMF